MADEPTQRTREGAEIPVPARDDFLRNMQKVAPPAKPDDERDDDSPAVDRSRQ